MTETLLQEERIIEHLNFLRPVFTKRGFRHGLAYINGLIFAFKKSTKNITSKDPNYKHHSGIQRLLTSLRMDLEKLQKKYFVKIKYLFKGEISLIFDDSLLERNGKKVERTQNHHDHTSGGYLKGHQFFTAMLCADNIVLPLFPQLYHKKSSSKMDMAEELIEDISKKFSLTNILFDSWYSKKQIIRISRFKSRRVICGLKSDRKFSSTPKEWSKIREFVDDSQSKHILIDEKEYHIQSMVGRIKASKGKVLISRQVFTDSISKHFYIFSSDKSLTEVEILRLYHIRWNIEVFHRDVKQNLGFHPFVRKEKAIVRHSIFVTLAYAVLKIFMLFNNFDMTIGECISYLRESNYSNFIKEIVEIEDRSERLQAFQEVIINKSAQV